MERTALFAGSFDPVTVGHEALILRAIPLFDKIVVGLGENTQKHCRYSLQQRMEWLRTTFAACPSVEVASYYGLTTDFCRRRGIKYLLRGLRSSADFVYEENIARINGAVAPDIETVFLLSDARHGVVSSTMIRELAAFKKDVTPWLPEAIRDDFKLHVMGG